MKRIGILLGLSLLIACMMWAQDNTNSSGNATSSTTTTTSTTTTNDTATQDSPAQQTDQATRDAHKDAAVRDENAAESAKQQAKDAGTKEGSHRKKSLVRLDDAAKDLIPMPTSPHTRNP